VVLMTGLPVTDEDIVPAGAAILTKPFTYDELTRALTAQLEAKDRQNAARAASGRRGLPAGG